MRSYFYSLTYTVRSFLSALKLVICYSIRRCSEVYRLLGAILNRSDILRKFCFALFFKTFEIAEKIKSMAGQYPCVVSLTTTVLHSRKTEYESIGKIERNKCIKRNYGTHAQ